MPTKPSDEVHVGERVILLGDWRVILHEGGKAFTVFPSSIEAEPKTFADVLKASLEKIQALNEMAAPTVANMLRDPERYAAEITDLVDLTTFIGSPAGTPSSSKSVEKEATIRTSTSSTALVAELVSRVRMGETLDESARNGLVVCVTSIPDPSYQFKVASTALNTIAAGGHGAGEVRHVWAGLPEKEGDTLTVEQAAEELGLTVAGLRGRIARARTQGERTPFVLIGTQAYGRLVADREALKRWDATFRRTGPRKGLASNNGM